MPKWTFSRNNSPDLSAICCAEFASPSNTKWHSDRVDRAKNDLKIATDTVANAVGEPLRTSGKFQD